MATVNVELREEIIPLRELRQGEFGIAEPGTPYPGILLMGAYGERWVSLDDGNTWSGFPDFKVRRLPKGTKISLIV